jgi:hypothetical protein
MEVVAVGGAILELNSQKDAEAFMKLDLVSKSSDTSVNHIARRLRLRWPL